MCEKCGNDLKENEPIIQTRLGSIIYNKDDSVFEFLAEEDIEYSHVKC